MANAIELLSKQTLMDFQEAMESLLIYVSNLIKYPDDLKYRKVKISNIHFQERLGRMNGCEEAMNAIGFVREHDFYVFKNSDGLTSKEMKDELSSIELILKQRLEEAQKAFSRLPHRHDDDAHVYSAVRAVGCHNERGKRPNNEDDEIVVDKFCNEAKTAFFGLYDGHGGRQTVDFVVRALHMTLERVIKNSPNENLEEVMKQTYLETDSQVRRHNILQSGTTAVTVLIRGEENRRVLYVANVGDSRAILCRNNVAKRLTVDHKPNLPEETKRIQDAGGFVAQGHRVNGVLAISRALGDHTLKSNDVVTAKPYTCTEALVSDDTFLILACDGLWDEVTDQEAVDFVRERIQNISDQDASFNRKLNEICRELVHHALDRGSTDNVTVMIVKL